eukprot:TRINITY_DN44928_c0_g1_i2.p1 TRINITY_DN44928_c0_g1~~TRINITY_DN44928_c0_g1_i2.p1  ORF type:complete len:112 (+),score=4.43 TRINITY_DN44928_c0_g1_i2:95-430(+)
MSKRLFIGTFHLLSFQWLILQVAYVNQVLHWISCKLISCKLDVSNHFFPQSLQLGGIGFVQSEDKINCRDHRMNGLDLRPYTCHVLGDEFLIAQMTLNEATNNLCPCLMIQ